MFQAIQIHVEDNVATVVRDCLKDESITIQSPRSNFMIKLGKNVPFGHKVALKNINKGEIVIKYGRVIGKATNRIVAGALVGVHNIEGLRGRGDLNVDGSEPQWNS